MTANDSADTEPLSSKWWALIVFLGFSALEISVLASGNLNFQHWRDWIIVLGAIFFPFLALLAATELTKDTRLTGNLRPVAVALQWVLAAPFVLVATVLIGWMLYSVIGWFATIPAWAAVIIVLLLIRR